MSKLFAINTTIHEETINKGITMKTSQLQYSSVLKVALEAANEMLTDFVLESELICEKATKKGLKIIIRDVCFKCDIENKCQKIINWATKDENYEVLDYRILARKILIQINNKNEKKD